MKRRAVVYLPAAQRDMLDAFDYIRKDSPAQAAAWLERMDKVLGRLAAFPRSGAVPKDRRLAARGYRLLVIGEHLAFYIAGPRRVEVHRVLHGRRRYEFLLASGSTRGSVPAAARRHVSHMRHSPSLGR